MAPCSRRPIQPQRHRHQRLRQWLFVWLLPLLLLLGADSAQAAMDYAKQVLIGADFHGADLREVTFSLTNLREANLSGADLRGASLFGAKLQDADLHDADLRGATLDSAVFDGTDLRQARLEDAFAFNTRFIDVRIDGADFTNVSLRPDVLRSLCEIASGSNLSSGRDTLATLDCP
ncbi:MAG: pentapeptide repeat-containing protein [Synechococcaceae cyanobacterium]